VDRLASQRPALEHLRLDRLTVVIPGEADYPLAEGIRVRGLNAAISPIVRTSIPSPSG
jgi:hypothetical protein